MPEAKRQRNPTDRQNAGVVDRMVLKRDNQPDASGDRRISESGKGTDEIESDENWDNKRREKLNTRK